ncbi:nucleoredoxin-like [Lytechinus pictus]|uniref:nucleoredoxin-like n=1 Tax=Lytechinus pictus TaxID=7653 RepID=UPI00240E3FE0|nr:nucleoredoxin-like [Lytechinus pictus]
MSLVELLGEKICQKQENGELVPVDTSTLVGSGRYVGIYFSAHWCPPCRMFTPVLAKFYKEFKEKNEGKLEIVFVSSDQTADQFKDYYVKEMPWKCVPYEDRERKEKLGEKYSVRGIPTFIILDSETCEVVCKQGRNKVMDDSEGDEFPWRE